MAKSEDAHYDDDVANKGAGHVVIPSREGEESLSPSAYTYSVPLTPGYSGPARPDPEGEALRARVAEQRRTGEWEDWFIDLPEKQDEAMRSVGLPRQLRERAAPHLHQLYPPSVCLRLQKNEQDYQVVRPFFNRWLPWIDPFIRLGLDLEVARPWSDKSLLGNLRSYENFASAQAELQIWASLIRFGYRLDREPPGPDGRRPDFAVYAGKWRYIVEVKTSRPSDGENLADDVRTAMQTFAEHLRRPGQSAKVCATRVLRALLDSEPGRASIIGADGKRELGILGEQLRKLADRGSPIGKHPAGDWFTIEITEGAEHPAGMVSSAVWEGLEDDRRAVRIASLVETALSQIPQAAFGVPLVNIAHPIYGETVARELRRRASEHPILFSCLSFVVLRWIELVSPVQFKHSGVVIPFRGRITRAERRMVQALIG